MDFLAFAAIPFMAFFLVTIFSEYSEVDYEVLEERKQKTLEMHHQKFTKLQHEILQYMLDPVLAIEYPEMNDTNVPETRKVIETLYAVQSKLQEVEHTAYTTEEELDEQLEHLSEELSKLSIQFRAAQQVAGVVEPPADRLALPDVAEEAAREEEQRQQMESRFDDLYSMYREMKKELIRHQSAIQSIAPVVDIAVLRTTQQEIDAIFDNPKFLVQSLDVAEQTMDQLETLVRTYRELSKRVIMRTTGQEVVSG